MHFPVRVKSKDSKIFTVTKNIVKQIGLLKNFLELESKKYINDDVISNDIIPLYEVDGSTLNLIIKWCIYHDDEDDDDDDEVYYKINNEEISPWDRNFLQNLEMQTIVNLINAANYLNIVRLLNTSCKYIADSIIIGKSSEEIRHIFKLEDDLSPEEKERIKEEHKWCQTPFPNIFKLDLSPEEKEDRN